MKSLVAKTDKRHFGQNRVICFKAIESVLILKMLLIELSSVVLIPPFYCVPIRRAAIDTIGSLRSSFVI